MSSLDGILLSRIPHSNSFITIGNYSTFLTSYKGTSTLLVANTSFHLKNVHVALALVCDLLFVYQYTHDNNCSIEFDALGFFVKDQLMERAILLYNSSGHLYTKIS